MDLLKLAIIEAAHQTPGLTKRVLGATAWNLLGSDNASEAVVLSLIDGLVLAKYLVRMEDFGYYLTPTGIKNQETLMKQLLALASSVQLGR